MTAEGLGADEDRVAAEDLVTVGDLGVGWGWGWSRVCGAAEDLGAVECIVTVEKIEWRPRTG